MRVCRTILRIRRQRPSLRAKRSNPAFERQKKAGLLRRYAPRNDAVRVLIRISNSRCASAFSRRDVARGLPEISLPSQVRGRRESRVRAAPDSRVCNGSAVKNAHAYSQVTPESPGFPRAMVYGLYALSSVSPALLATVARESCAANLTPALGVSGPHDFAVRFGRSRQERHPRPPHPRPALMTLRNAPLEWDGMAIDIACF